MPTLKPGEFKLVRLVLADHSELVRFRGRLEMQVGRKVTLSEAIREATALAISAMETRASNGVNA